MAELKTQVTNVNPIDFLNSVEDEAKKQDCIELLKIFNETTGYKWEMWWDSIIWFGSYHYKSERSTQEWDWPITWFSPRKQNITIYIMPWFSNYNHILEKIGKHKISKWSCLYIKQISDIDLNILKELIEVSVADMKKNYITK